MSKSILLGLLLTTAAVQAADLSSLIFYEYTHNATEGVAEDGKFETGRAYLTITDKPADNLSYRLQLDAGRMNDGADDSDKMLEVFVKNACVDWKTGLGKWTFGMQGMNMFNMQEANFGYRFLAKPLMDEHGFSSSADMGVGYANEFGGLVKASLLYTNGGGFKKAESDKYKKLSLQVMAGESALSKKDGWNAGLVYSLEPVSADDSKTVMGLFGGWAGMGARLGAEFDTKTTTGAVDVTEQIIGFYGNYKLPIGLPLDLFANVAMVDPDTNTDDDGLTDLIIGVAFKPAKGLVIAPNLRTISHEASGSDPDTWYRVNFEFKI
ncbi:MAG: hypothetical protein Q8O14_03510 [bacterium]|nr:hypothetical protein [bacterium]